MAKKELTKTSKMLLLLCAGLEMLGSVLITPKELRRRARRGDLFKSGNNLDSFIYYLYSNGSLLSG